MDDLIDVKEEIDVINQFTTQLRNSGYGYSQARDIIQSAMKGIVRKKENREKKEEISRRYKSG